MSALLGQHAFPIMVFMSRERNDLGFLQRCRGIALSRTCSCSSGTLYTH